MVLQKRNALEYLEGQAGPVTAKALAIDLDTRASTASELMERMAAQGLVSRITDQRPREYSLTEAGRKRLEYFRSRDSEPHIHTGGSDGASSPSPDVPTPDIGAMLDGLREELCSRLDDLREYMGDVMERLGPHTPSPGEGEPPLSGKLKELLARAEALVGDKEVMVSSGGPSVAPQQPQGLPWYKRKEA